MQPKLITSFFTANSLPASGLNPTIRIWIVTPGAQTLVVSDDPMVEVGDGFYKYNFAAYDSINDYVVRSDGSAVLANNERYQVAANENFIDDIEDAVWNASKVDYLAVGSMGEAINATDANVDQLRLDVVSMMTLIELLVKYETNRTMIDKTLKTLTVFDNDGTTPLQVFNLFDGAGAPSVAEVCERVPV